MNIEKGWRIPPSHQTTDHLAQAAWDFSDILAAGRWNQKRVHEVEITRLITERVGFETELLLEDIDPIFTETKLSFSALKRFIEGPRGGFDVMPHYSIASTTSQMIDKKDIPENVLEEIFEDAEDGESPLAELLEDDDEIIDWAGDNLDEFELVRRQEVEYEIGPDGDIEDYTVSYSYLFDDTIVHEVGYTESHQQVLFTPIHTTDGKVYEQRPIVVPLLTEMSIPKEIEGIDTEFEQFLFNKSLREVTEFSAQPKEEHIRRILAMMSLLGSGLVR